MKGSQLPDVNLLNVKLIDDSSFSRFLIVAQYSSISSNECLCFTGT